MKMGVASIHQKTKKELI